MNSCQNCGKERHPVAKPGNCHECHHLLLREKFKIEWKVRLEEMGFDTTPLKIHKGIKSQVTVINRKCGHRFTAQMSNILNGATECGICGPKHRTKNATKAYVAKYGRDYDLKLWKDYKLKVEALSNKTYVENLNLLNPMGLPRVKPNTHPDAVNLDHILPIIHGFKNGVLPERMASLDNLRIIAARDNLRRRQKLTPEAKVLLQELLS